mmetsp:Transcript_129/g.605  ORF Transcript_129/g.605 Transcript_129/m.605 type:complete len:280 (-) Transcript_129:186-1025(-)
MPLWISQWPQTTHERAHTQHVRHTDDPLTSVPTRSDHVRQAHHVTERVRRHRPEQVTGSEICKRCEPSKRGCVRKLRCDRRQRGGGAARPPPELPEVVQVRGAEAHGRQEHRGSHGGGAAPHHKLSHARSKRKLLGRRRDVVVPQFEHTVDVEGVCEPGEQTPVDREVRQGSEEERDGQSEGGDGGRRGGVEVGLDPQRDDQGLWRGHARACDRLGHGRRGDGAHERHARRRARTHQRCEPLLHRPRVVPTFGRHLGPQVQATHVYGRDAERAPPRHEA